MLVAVAVAETATIRTEARVNRSQKRFGFGGGSGSPEGGGFLLAQPGPWGASVIAPPTRARPKEGVERLSIGRQRGDRDPLLGPVVAGADRAELDRRHPHPQEGDRVGGAVAAGAHPPPAPGRRGRLARAPTARS